MKDTTGRELKAGDFVYDTRGGTIGILDGTTTPKNEVVFYETYGKDVRNFARPNKLFKISFEQFKELFQNTINRLQIPGGDIFIKKHEEGYKTIIKLHKKFNNGN